MLYLQEYDIRTLHTGWMETVSTVGSAVNTLIGGDYCQPIKPYLRWGDRRNRIIAMPAYVGGEHSAAGIKWIASFPGNLANGMKRAHSLTVLNDVDTGKPVCLINTALVSGIRTASLSGFILLEFLDRRPDLQKVDIGIVGFGVIGQLHLEMIMSLLGDKSGQVFLYDKREIDPALISPAYADKVVVCSGWKEVYESSDVFITCTVTDSPYISGPPKRGSLLLNISLRDFEPEIMRFVDKMLVDNWEEVCRENTDIERMSHKYGLQKSDTYGLEDLAERHPFDDLKESDVVMFNPMGMAVFDVALGNMYFRRALKDGVGLQLADA